MTIVFWNQGAERLFGYTAEEALGQTTAFLSAPDLPAEPSDLRERLSRGEPSAFFETERRARDGRAVWVAVTVSPIRDARGNLIGFADIERDITGHRHVEQALRENERLLHAQRRQLVDADRRKDDFLAALSHELRNPLASLSNTVNVLCNGERTEGQDIRWGLELIRRQTERLAHLVNDLLDMSRIARGTVVLRLTRFDVHNAVDEAVQEARWLIEQRNLALTVTRADGPIWIEADPTRLIQIFNGLILNAAKNTSDAGRIDVAIERRERQATVRIRDDGAGMSAPELPHVFDTLLQRVAGARARDDASPIPLAFLRQLIELHGGKVHAASGGPGKGSEFVVQLPLDRTPQTS